MKRLKLWIFYHWVTEIMTEQELKICLMKIWTISFIFFKLRILKILLALSEIQ